MIRLLITALLLAPLLAHGQIFKSVDENGNTVYSDKPPAGGGEAESVDLPKMNRTLPPPDIPRSAPQDAKDEAPEMTVAIVSPVEDTVIPIGAAGNFSVRAKLNLPSAGGTEAQLLMDGVAIGPPQSFLSWSLTNVFRGTHILTVAVIDESGESVTVSEPVTIHVRRPSKNF